MATLIPYDGKVKVSEEDFEVYYQIAYNILKSYLLNIDCFAADEKTKALIENALIIQINHLYDNEYLLEEVGGINSLSVISFNISFANTDDGSLIMRLTSNKAYMLIRDLITARLQPSCEQGCLW